MTRWYRFYDDSLDDTKVQRLNGEMFKTWVNLLSLASKSCGKLPSLDEIAFRLRISTADAQTRVDDLILAGLIDIMPDRSLQPHSWMKRQFPADRSLDRMKKYRSKKRIETTDKPNVTASVTALTVTCDGQRDVTRDATIVTCDALDQIRSDKNRKLEEERFSNLNLTESSGRRQVDSELVRRAEGLGCAIEGFLIAASSPKVKNPSGYFQKLCAKELQCRLPGLSASVAGRALCGDAGAYGIVCNLLVSLPEASK